MSNEHKNNLKINKVVNYYKVTDSNLMEARQKLALYDKTWLNEFITEEDYVYFDNRSYEYIDNVHPVQTIRIKESLVIKLQYMICGWVNAFKCYTKNSR